MAECNELAQFVFEVREVISDGAYLTSMNNIAKIKKELDRKDMLIADLSSRVNLLLEFTKEAIYRKDLIIADLSSRVNLSVQSAPIESVPPVRAMRQSGFSGWRCECGCVFSHKSALAPHRRTRKHARIMAQIELNRAN